LGLIFFYLLAFAYFSPLLCFLKHLRLDDRTFLWALGLMSAAVLLFFGAIGNFWTLLAVNLLFGAAMSVTLPFIETRALEHLDRKRYGRARLFGSIGFIAIALWLGKVLQTPQDAIFYLVATILLWIITFFQGQIKSTLQTLRENPKGLFLTIAGAFSGPFLGVLMFLPFRPVIGLPLIGCSAPLGPSLRCPLPSTAWWRLRRGFLLFLDRLFSNVW
jgi:PPP family 3-phenylpropionic acid transporter